MAHFARTLIREVFHLWDVNGSGMIEKQELAAVLDQLGSFKPGEIDKIILQADKNGDGKIQYDAFVDWLMRPVITVGAAALLSKNDLCLRAERASFGNPVKGTADEPARWVFGEPGIRPVFLAQDVPLRCEHTLVAWARLDLEAAESDFLQLVGDSRPGWGFTFGVSKDGRLGILDPRRGKEAQPLCAEKEIGVESGAWAMCVMRGMCSTNKPTSRGKTELLIATDKQCIRLLGTVDCVGSGLVVSEFGSLVKGVVGIASVSLWPRLLADEELKELFVWDAVRLGCVDEVEGAWLKLNRRRPPSRSEDEEALLTSRLETAARGKCQGTLDLQDMKVVDADLPRIFSAVEAGFSSLSALLLSGNYISEDGVREHVVPFLWRLTIHFKLDISGNLDINNYAEEPLLDVVTSLPPVFGITVDARNTGLSGAGIQTLLNPSPQAEEASMMAAKEAARTLEMQTAYDATQTPLEDRWATETDGPVDVPSSGGLPVAESANLFDEAGTATSVTTEINRLLLRNGAKDFTKGIPLKEALIVPAMKTATRLEIKKGRDSVEIADLTTKACDASVLLTVDTFSDDLSRLLEKTPFEKFPEGTKTAVEDKKHVRSYLAMVARAMYDHRDGPKFAWSRASGRGLPDECSTGQLIAHFSYLSFSVRPRSHEDFGLRLRAQGEAAPKKLLNDGAIGLHSAVEDGKVRLEAASGKSYGHDALKMKLKNTTANNLCIAVQAGTIFQQQSWIHRQNLVVGRTVHVSLTPGQTKEQKVGAYCMNQSCACADDDPMNLTALFLEDASLLQSQGKIWNHFEGLFSKYRAEAGFPDGAKGKKGKKK